MNEVSSEAEQDRRVSGKPANQLLCVTERKLKKVTFTRLPLCVLSDSCLINQRTLVELHHT
jgi:hypothetical protein